MTRVGTTTTIVSVLLGAAMTAPVALGDVVLSEKIMKLALTGAELSSLAYDEDPVGTGYDAFAFYDDEPDQALVAEKDGYCFAAFRGTTLTWVDWQQNFELGKEEVCAPQFFLGPRNCCNTRSGFYKAYHTKYEKALEAAIRKCSRKCTNMDECVVFTGHSQGGAIASVAGLAMADLNPYVITFGQPATVDENCPLISSERWYRFVNTKATVSEELSYDPVPFVPGMGAVFYGHMIMLGEDATGIAYIGLDSQTSFSPLDTLGFQAHSMIGSGTPFKGYADRLGELINTTDHFPIRANGFADHSQCSQDLECMSGVCKRETTFSFPRCVGTECTSNDQCESDRCDSGNCIPKLDSCQPCDEDSDCSGGKCTLFRCSGSSGLMDDNCICKWDSDCESGRCELLETGTCEAKLPIGSTCDEDSDCTSDFCSWKFKCEAKKRDGDVCANGRDCASGKCNWWFVCVGDGPESAAASVLPAGGRTIHGHFGMNVVKSAFLVGMFAMFAKYAVPAYRRYRNGYEPVEAAELTV